VRVDFFDFYDDVLKYKTVYVKLVKLVLKMYFRSESLVPTKSVHKLLAK